MAEWMNLVYILPGVAAAPWLSQHIGAILLAATLVLPAFAIVGGTHRPRG